MTRTPRQPDPDTAHAWAETRALHPVDSWLRDHSFQIAGRPRRGPTRWRRGGVVYDEAAARAVAEAEDEARAGKGD